MKISEAAFEELFGIMPDQIKRLGLEPEMVDDELVWSLEEVCTRCKRTVAKTMATRIETGQTMGADTIKLRKLQAQATKLELANNQVEAGLLDRESHAADCIVKVEAVKSIIREIPDRVLELAPDIETAAMAIVQAEVEAAIGPHSR